MHSLIPNEKIKDGSNDETFMGIVDSTSGRINSELNTISLSDRELQ